MVDDVILMGQRTIQKEAQALSAFAPLLNESFSKACRWILECKGTVVLTGMGKSGLVARKWSSTLSSTGTRSYFLNPAEASHGDLGILGPDDLLIALSNSGETEELGVVLRHCREMGSRSIGVTSRENSSLARQTDVVLSVSLSEEACPLGLAPTTSTTLMMALGDAVAVTLMQMRGFTESDFGKLHPGGAIGRRLWLRVSELMHQGEKLPIVSPNESIGQTILEMTKKCLGVAIVLEGDEILGIITDGDLRRHLERINENQTLTAVDIMTKNPRVISQSALAVEARDILEKNKIQQILVVDDREKLVGIVHFHDLMRARVV